MNVTDFIMMNTSRMDGLNHVYEAKEVIERYCDSIPHAFFVGMLLIFSFYTLSYNILPRLKKLKYVKAYKVIDKICDMLDLVGFSVCLYFMYIGWYRHVGLWFNVWSLIILGVLILGASETIIVWIYDTVIAVVEEWKK